MTDKVIWGTPSLWIERLPLFYGKEAGVFQKYGVEPEVKIFHGGPELLQQVREGQVHIGEIGLPPFTKAFSEGLSARIVASTFIRQLDHYVAALPEIRSLADLRGKKIGILSRGSCDEYFIRLLLETEGIDSDQEVEIVPLGDDYGKLDNFSCGKIDAGFLVEPRLSHGESMNQVKVVARVGDYLPRYQWGGIFATDEFIDQHADQIKALMDGYRETLLLVKEEPDAAVKFGSEFFQMEDKVFKNALERNIDDWEMEAVIDRVGLENCIRIQAELNAIPPDIKAADMVFEGWR